MKLTDREKSYVFDRLDSWNDGVIVGFTFGLALGFACALNVFLGLCGLAIGWILVNRAEGRQRASAERSAFYFRNQSGRG